MAIHSSAKTAAADSAAARPIGVFDSGVGGLTVLRALRQQLPGEHFIYLGDTARLPYGTKSGDSVQRYSLQAAQCLFEQGIKALVIACNTASAVALDVLGARFAPMPVIGVVQPGALAGVRASRRGHIAVLATEATVQGGAYQRAIAALRPGAQVVARACSLFVALAEEGWHQGDIAEAVAHRYLDDLLRADPRIDTLVLGCTHFPVVVPALRAVVGEQMTIVESAQTTAAAVLEQLQVLALCNPQRQAPSPRLLATDGPERFARVGSRFLGEAFTAADVELVDLAPVRAG